MEKSFKDILQHIASDPQLHTSHLYILSKMDKESLTTFQETWPNVAVQRRRDVMQELLEIAEANFEVDFVPVFLLGLGDDDADVRATAVKSLWEYEDVSLVPVLVHMLKTDEAPLVREATASALGQFVYLNELEELNPNVGKMVEEALLETIYQATEDLHVRRRAIESVSFSADARIGPIIENAYFHDNAKMQVSAIFAMGRNADSRWLPSVIEELDNPNTEIRFEACRACGELEAKDAVARLITLIEEDADIEVQEMAIWALGRIGGDLAREALEACLELEQPVLVQAAEESLDELNLFADAELMLYDFDEDGDVMDFDDLPGEGPNGHPTNQYLN